MKASSTPVALIAAVLALAGCLGDEAATDEDTAAADDAADIPTSADDANFDDETGAMEGIVTDEELRPLGGATVNASGRSTRTAVDGAFAFGRLDPGAYLVLAKLDGYMVSTAQVTVERGKLRSGIELRLAPEPLQIEYHKTLPAFSGVFACGVGLTHSVPDACAGAAGGSQIKFPLTFDDVGIVSGILLELDWDAVGPGENGKILAMDYNPKPDRTLTRSSTSGVWSPAGYGNTGGWAYGTSPMNLTHIEHNSKNLLYQRGGPYGANVTVHPMFLNMTTFTKDPTHPTSSGLLVNQRFDLYATIFYHGARPEPGFTALP